jgi:GGDEF domain-containing protein
MDVFKIMLNHELEKAKYYKESKLLLAGISILNLYELRHRLGRHSHETLSKEIMREVKNLLNPIDLICMDQDDTIYISMLHTELKTANEILEKISAVLSSLINDNFNQFKVDIKMASLEMPVGAPIDTQIDQLKSLLS